MSVIPVSDKTETWKASRPRPAGLNPIIMSGWVTPSNDAKASDPSSNEANDVNDVNENEDIENPAKKRIKVSELPYVQKCEEEESERVLKRY